MFDKDRWIEIFETIKKNKLRTFLAGFTVALGIFIFIMLFGLANGLENTFEKYFKDDQLNTIWINGSRTSKPYAGYESNRRIRLKNEDLEDIQNKYDFFSFKSNAKTKSYKPKIESNSESFFFDICFIFSIFKIFIHHMKIPPDSVITMILCIYP